MKKRRAPPKYLREAAARACIDALKAEWRISPTMACPEGDSDEEFGYAPIDAVAAEDWEPICSKP